MTKNANPSIQQDPANNGTLAGALKFVLDKFKAWNIDDMLPVKVVAYNKDASPPSVQVQPLIVMIDTNGNQYDRAQIASLPVLNIGGGGFLIYFNIKPGDIGFMKSNDRDLSVFFQSLGQSQPNTNRTHSFSDAVFIPAVLGNYIIDPSDTGMVIQNLLGTVKISLTDTKIKIMAPTVEIDSSAFNITASMVAINATALNITVPVVTLTGNLNVIGNITATGSITPFV